MHHDGKFQVPGVFERPAHHARRHDGPSVVGDADAARFFQFGHVGELLAERAAGDGPGRQDAGETGFPRARLDEPGDRCAVADGARVGHGDQRGDSPGGGSAGPGRDGFLALLARLTQVDVQVDEPREHQQSAAIVHFVRLAFRRARGRFADFADAAAVENHSPRAIDAGGRIDHAAAVEEDHADTRARRQRASAAMRTATPLST